MNPKKTKKIVLVTLVIGVAIIGALIFIAYSRTWGKTELEFNIHINEQLVLQSVYGESPTFAIWLENSETGQTQTIFVTGRAGTGDWEGKTEVPTALPKWDEVNRIEKHAQSKGCGVPSALDAVTGATPKPGYFTTRIRVEPGSKWICWIEMNLSGDYNEYYRQFDETGGAVDEYGSGQPALVYRAKIEAMEGNTATPEAVGMSLPNAKDGKIIHPLEGITTALEVFDEISIKVAKPKPKIVERRD